MMILAHLVLHAVMMSGSISANCVIIGDGVTISAGVTLLPCAVYHGHPVDANAIIKKSMACSTYECFQAVAKELMAYQSIKNH